MWRQGRLGSRLRDHTILYTYYGTVPSRRRGVAMVPEESCAGCPPGGCECRGRLSTVVARRRSISGSPLESALPGHSPVPGRSVTSRMVAVGAGKMEHSSCTGAVSEKAEEAERSNAKESDSQAGTHIARTGRRIGMSSRAVGSVPLSRTPPKGFLPRFLRLRRAAGPRERSSTAPRVGGSWAGGGRASASALQPPAVL